MLFSISASIIFARMRTLNDNNHEKLFERKIFVALV